MIKRIQDKWAEITNSDLITKGSSVTDVTRSVFRKIHRRGKLVHSRAGDTVELSPHTVIVSNDSINPYTVLPKRGNNVFHVIAETLWVWAGRNDVGSLMKWLPRAKDYSDNWNEHTQDGVWRAGYGPRLRFWPARDGRVVDQVEVVVRRLRKSTDTRQALMSIYDPGADSVEGSKDYPCLGGETLMKSPEGDITLKELSARFAEGLDRYPVYSFNSESREVNLSWCTQAWCSGKKKMIKLTFDDGTFLRCTPDHVLFQKVRKGNGNFKSSSTHVKEIAAGELKVGDRLWATAFIKGHQNRDFYVRNLSENWSYTNQIPVHRDYYEFVHGVQGSDIDIHHIDGNVSNNALCNLEAVSHGSHSSHHRSIDNPMWNPETVSKQSVSQSEVMRRHHASKTPEQREAHKLACKRGLDARQNRKNTKDKGEPLLNHKIVSIEEDSEEEVYDFTVPGCHNAIVGTGIVVHNCNNLVHFLVRPGKYAPQELHMFVQVRSNDAVYGFNINTFEWLFLGEYVASQLDIPLTRYEHKANSLHVYQNLMNTVGKVLYHYVPLPKFSAPVSYYSDLKSVNPENWRKICDEVYNEGRVGVVGDAPQSLKDFSIALYSESALNAGDEEGFLNLIGEIEDPRLVLALLEIGQRRLKTNFAGHVLIDRYFPQYSTQIDHYLNMYKLMS